MTWRSGVEHLLDGAVERVAAGEALAKPALQELAGWILRQTVDEFKDVHVTVCRHVAARTTSPRATAERLYPAGSLHGSSRRTPGPIRRVVTFGPCGQRLRRSSTPGIMDPGVRRDDALKDQHTS